MRNGCANRDASLLTSRQFSGGILSKAHPLEEVRSCVGLTSRDVPRSPRRRPTISRAESSRREKAGVVLVDVRSSQ